MTNIEPEALQHETAIVWLIDPANMPYVREELIDAPFRTRRPAHWRLPGQLAGYAMLADTATSTNGFFARRVFWLAPYDRIHQPNGVYHTGAPVEAVDPMTVAPKVPGRMTPRAWGKPLEGTPA